jgi:uncharacterized membrane protein YphA (DoxX/SURF4 family)
MKITLEFNLSNILRWLLGIIFTWAALSKIANLQDFYSSLAGYQLPLPDVFLRLTATTLPWLELMCGLLLLAQLWGRAALLWVLLLSGVFLVCTGQAWARGLEVSCGCLSLDFLGLGAASKSGTFEFLESVKFAFFRSLFLIAAALYLLLKGIKARESSL